MSLKNLSDIHTTRNAKRIEYDIDRGSIFEEWHVLDWKDLGDDALVSMATCELVTVLDLSLLCDVDADDLIDTSRKVVTLIDVLDLHIDDTATFTMWHLE